MKLRPPKVIRVGAMDVPVKVMNGMEALGSFGDEGIYLRPTQTASSLRDTVLHELLHGIIFVGGLRKLLDLDLDREEQLVGAIAPWLLAALRDNPQLVEFLLENR